MLGILTVYHAYKGSVLRIYYALYVYTQGQFTLLMKCAKSVAETHEIHVCNMLKVVSHL